MVVYQGRFFEPSCEGDVVVVGEVGVVGILVCVTGIMALFALHSRTSMCVKYIKLRKLMIRRAN